MINQNHPPNSLTNVIQKKYNSCDGGISNILLEVFIPLKSLKHIIFPGGGEADWNLRQDRGAAQQGGAGGSCDSCQDSCRHSDSFAGDSCGHPGNPPPDARLLPAVRGHGCVMMTSLRLILDIITCHHHSPVCG